MGEVFRATDEQLGREVAVKLLLPTERDARAAERFHREARAAARLNDPHVVAVYDFGNHDDGFFLVMELVEGGSVSEELTQHGPLPKDRAIDLIEQSAMGLAAAHREDVVHRDVKPSNLLLTADGTVKVADFGIAHLPGEGVSTLTATGQIMGSAHYIAPEQARGAQAGKPADVYALGCVLYQLVTGEPPFTGEHPAALLYQHVDAEPVHPSLTRPELAGSFELVLLQMLAKDPADRPTADEIAAGSLRTFVPAPVERVVTSPLPPLAPPPESGGRRKTLLVGGIAVLAAAAAVVTALLLNGDPKNTPPTTDVGPNPSVSTSPTNPATTRPTQPATSRTTSSQPTQTTSPSPTPTPSPSPTPTTSTTSPEPSSPTTTTQPTTAPTTRATPSPEPSTSPTPPPDSPSPTPASDTPTPAAQSVRD